MYLRKYYNFDKYVLISKDTDNECTWTFSEMSLSMIMHKRGGNDRLGPDSVQKYRYSDIWLANAFHFIVNTLVKEK